MKEQLATNEGFMFFTDHYPSLLSIDPTRWSLSSWPITGVVYSLPGAVIRLNPTAAVTKKPVTGNGGAY